MNSIENILKIVPENNRSVIIFLKNSLEGFSEVCWFPLVHLPYEEMMTDMLLWLPLTLADHEGQFLEAEFVYADEALRIVDRHQLKFHQQPVST